MGRKKRINPLLAIMNPREIPLIMKKFKKIDYVDKVYFKYTKTPDTLANIEKYFLEHKQYTHVIINSDDGAPDYDGIAMLIADAQKYDFPVISGCCCVNKLTNDMSLNLTFKPVTKERKKGAVDRTSYNSLPKEFLELKGIVRVWFQGNAVNMVRRDVVEKIGLNTWFGGTGDIQFSFDCWKHDIPQYADLRVYFEHSKFPSISLYKILIGERKPEIVAVDATAPIPERNPAPIIRTIPEKYCNLMNFYYGCPKEIKICIVSEFEQKGYFQWYEALRKYSTAPQNEYGKWHHSSGWTRHIIQLNSVLMNPSTMKQFSPDNDYWKPIKEADVVLVYCARHTVKDIDGNPWKWYMLPVWTKELMSKKGKMIAQFDAEFMFLWYPEHIYWDDPIPEIEGKKPKEFFDETGVLNVADAYFTVLENPPWGKYTQKLIYYMPLPQLFRYKRQIRKWCPFYYFNGNKDLTNKKVAVILHSVKNASVEHTIDNVLEKVNVPIIRFSSQLSQSANELETLSKYHKGSEVYGMLPRDAYLDILSKAYMAIDDNEGYVGWSRFVMECAILGVPCVGSQKAVKEIFPDLYTKHKSYRKQKELVNKLLINDKFYEFMVKCGWLRVVQGSLSDIYLCTEMLRIVLFDLNCNYKQLIDEEKINYAGFVDFLVEHYLNPVCRRPNHGESIFDRNSRRILDQKQWDVLYGKWRKILDNPETYKKCLKIAMAKS